MTPAAVSQQIKALERWLKEPLFRRYAQGLTLTDAGRALAPGFSCAFDALGAAVQEMRAAIPGGHVHIAALPSVAQLWLTPRLKALRASLPSVKPSIHALEAPPNFRREPFDLAIFFVDRRTIDDRRVPLSEDRIFPVCSADVARRLRAPGGFDAVTLLYDTSWADDWTLWAQAAGQNRPDLRDGMAFSLYSAAAQAAIDGAGVLMGHEALVGEALAAGALVAPFRKKVTTGRILAVLLPPKPSAAAVEIVARLAQGSAGAL